MAIGLTLKERAKRRAAELAELERAVYDELEDLNKATKPITKAQHEREEELNVILGEIETARERLYHIMYG